MSQPVNPYTDWLDIAETACPPNHFDLLGIKESEDNEVRIKSAYYRRVAKISVFEYGTASELCQDVLKELAEARDCLIDPSSRLSYLGELASQSRVHTVAKPKRNRFTPSGADRGGQAESKARANDQGTATARPSRADLASRQAAAFLNANAQPTASPRSTSASRPTPAVETELRKAASLARSRDVERSQDRPMHRAKKPFGMMSVVRTPSEILEELIARRGLTPYQAQKFVDGDADALAIGPYIIESEYPFGFWGDVFTASRISTGEIVSLRLLVPSLRVDLPLLRAIMRKTDRLEAPLFQQPIDCGKHDERIFIASEFINGEDLGALVQRSGGLSAYQAIYCIDCLAKGLNKAFQKGITHGEIRPGKILANPKGDLHLADLALANAVVTAKQGNKSIDGLLRVLPQSHLEFSAPEAFSIASRELIHGDMYSLGCLLYFMIAGVPPFQRNESLELIFAHREATPPSLRDLDPGLPSQLDQCLQRLLAKNPSQRYASYSEMRQALQKSYQALPKLDITPKELWQQVQWNTGLEAKSQEGIRRYRFGKMITLTAAAVGIVIGLFALNATLRDSEVAAEAPVSIPQQATKPRQPETILIDGSDLLDVPTMEADDYFEVK